MALYGSLNNRLMDGNDPQKATVGMKATVLLYSDRTPAVITEVERDPKTGRVKAVMVQELEWTAEPWPSGYAKEVHMDKPSGNPYRVPVATRGKKKGMLPGLGLGYHDAYRDPHF
jgi:hypothetical protein